MFLLQTSAVQIQTSAHFYAEHLFAVKCIGKTKIKKKTPGMTHLKKYLSLLAKVHFQKIYLTNLWHVFVVLCISVTVKTLASVPTYLPAASQRSLTRLQHNVLVFMKPPYLLMPVWQNAQIGPLRCRCLPLSEQVKILRLADCFKGSSVESLVKPLATIVKYDSSVAIH